LTTLQSMTGFASSSREDPAGTLLLEVRGVNHRYLELQFRLPDALRLHEPLLRELFTHTLKRGKVDCRAEWHPRESQSTTLIPHTQTLEQLQRAASIVQEVFTDATPLSVVDILRWPGVLPQLTTSLPNATLVTQLAEEVLQSLQSTRQREGQKLGQFLVDQVRQMKQVIAPLGPKIPALVKAYQAKLTHRLRDALGTEEEARVLQEVTLWASKIDVAEELTRLEVHLDEVSRVVKQGGQSGKRLDFLMQELHREANTLGSKAVSSELAQASLELNLLIEQMREQVQNLE